MKLWIRAGLLAALVASVPVLPLEAGAKYTAQGFAFETEQKPQVMVVRPNMFMGTLDSANRQIEDPEWLAQAHVNMQEALKRHPASTTVEWRFADWSAAASQPLSEGFWKTFLNLNLDIAFRVPQGSFPIPLDANLGRATKNLPKGHFEYRLPPSELEEVRVASLGARYALLIKMHDAYTTDGAKLGRLLGGMANVMADGVNTMPPPPHFGFSILVDTEDGKVFWYYNDGVFGGDLRKPVSADKRVGQMLTGWPMPR
ncbi:MAG: hypothetical protein O9293_03315 [Porphyrobacter sp.]|nr:hypothetical protein [Porphyrobacter sp.]